MTKIITNDPQDKQLRARVKLLGRLLGEVIESQIGPDMLAAVEKLRTGYIQLRKQDDPVLRAELSEFIQQQTPDDLILIILSLIHI